MSSTKWFKGAEFQEYLLSFMCRDRVFLRQFGFLLTADDFKPSRKDKDADERYIVAKEALTFWRKYKDPIGGFLKANILEYIETHETIGTEKKKNILEIVNKISRQERIVAYKAVEDKIKQYLKDKLMREQLETLVDKQSEGSISPEDFQNSARKVGEYSERNHRTVVEFHTKKALDERQRRRTHRGRMHRPYFLIDDLDIRTKNIGRGDMGLVVGLYGKGKSLLLAHFADAYAKQGYRVLYITLEDPVDEVEDRMDAAVAYIPIDKLDLLPKKLAKRFERFRAVVRGRIKIVDGTDGNVTVPELEEIWERERDNGFIADVVIVDYDKELKPVGKYRERRFEFEEIYTQLRQFASRKGIYLWTAAQARRLKESHKIVTPENIGEDIGKAQKSTMIIGIGQGEHHPKARYLWVGKHKRGNSQFGFEVMTNFKRGLMYDRAMTMEMKRNIKSMRKKMRAA